MLRSIGNLGRWACLLAGLALIPICSASPLDPRGLSQRQSSSGAYVITGVASGRNSDGSLPFRQEIRVLQQDADQWNLYLLGLSELQSRDQSEKLSYYQLAGIHGRPYQAWDGVYGANVNNGYCTHSSVLFATWHRPYLALFEQVLYDIIQDLARQFPGNDHERYVRAAANFRIPYWDWASTSSDARTVLPDSIGGSAIVTVNTPQGVQNISNPLYSYRFHPLNANELPNPPYSTWQNTLRYPSSNDPDAFSQDNLVEALLENNRFSFRDRLYNLFTSYPNYNNFTNKAWLANDPGNYDSLESVHDQIHGLTGAGGHMAVVDYSAFDPVFWLHHAMVDRSFAIWQALYPDSWIEPEASQFGTFTTNPGAIEDTRTGLTPFHSSPLGFFDSDYIRNQKLLGYTYPELVDWNVSPEQYQANVRAAVNRLYGNIPPSFASHRRSSEISEREEADANATTSSDGQPSKPAIPSGPTYREYLANLRVAKFALDGSFYIHVFLGDFNDADPKSWPFAPSLVGTHCVFVNSKPSSSASDAPDKSAAQVTGTIPLTTALLNAISAGNLTSLDPPAVETYLKKNLHWRITLLNEEPVPPAEVPNLKVSVVSAEVTKAGSHDTFPVWSPDVTVHYDVTDCRPGGLSRGDPS